MSNKSDPKELILKNVGPFDEQGLKIRFGEKLHKDKANIHILVGENGSGKSTVLKGLFFKYYSGVRIPQAPYFILNDYFIARGSLISEFNDNFFRGFYPKDKQFDTTDFPIKIYYYTPNESLVQKDRNSFWRKNRDSGDNIIPNWVVNYTETDYLEYIEKLQDIKNKVKLYELGELEMDLELYNQRKTAIPLTEKIKKLVESIYNIKDGFEYKDTKDGYRPAINDIAFEFNQLSLGYRQIINLVTDLLIKVWDSTISLEKKEELPFLLLLDEIDIHLHPKAQRRILPALQEMFPNAEIFCTTHSPFVVNSVSDAWVYELSEENYTVEKDGLRVLEGKRTSILNDYEIVLINNFNYSDDFGGDAVVQLNNLHSLIKAENKDLQKIKEIVDKVRESENISLIKKVEFELLQNNIDL